MKRRAVCLVISIGALLGGVVISAPTAEASTKGTCTASFSLVNANKWGDAGRATDHNGNGWLCQKPITSTPDTFNVIDDKL